MENIIKLADTIIVEFTIKDTLDSFHLITLKANNENYKKAYDRAYKQSRKSNVVSATIRLIDDKGFVVGRTFLYNPKFGQKI